MDDLCSEVIKQPVAEARVKGWEICKRIQKYYVHIYVYEENKQTL